MKDDIKKKFLDILFETESEKEVIVDEPIKDVKLEETPSVLKAQDILYKKERSNSFLDINKEDKPVKEEKNDSSVKYSLKPNISPMFGVVKNGEPVEVEKEEKPVNMSAPLKKSHDSYLGTIISPIYGYDVKNDFSNTMNLSIHKVEEVEPEIVEEPEEEKSYYVKENDILDDNQNALSTDDLDQYISANSEDDFINEEFEEVNPNEELIEEYEESEIEDYASDPIFKEVLNEERGFQNTEEIDLFEDLFKEDEE